ncbi:MAG: cobalamin-dependent protein [Promethearchaeota archaeon]
MRPIRVYMAKPGVDGHWRGIVTVSRGLRDAGMEVVFGGFQSAQEIVDSALDEDCDVIGVSVHSGAHLAHAKRLVDALRRKSPDRKVLLMMGGAIPRTDFEQLKEAGVDVVFGPGTMIPDVVKFIEENVVLEKPPET